MLRQIRLHLFTSNYSLNMLYKAQLTLSPCFAFATTSTAHFLPCNSFSLHTDGKTHFPSTPFLHLLSKTRYFLLHENPHPPNYSIHPLNIPTMFTFRIFFVLLLVSVRQQFGFACALCLSNNGSHISKYRGVNIIQREMFLVPGTG